MITSYIISLKNPLDLINQLKTFDFNTILIDGVKTNTLSSKRKKNLLVIILDQQLFLIVF